MELFKIVILALVRSPKMFSVCAIDTVRSIKSRNAMRLRGSVEV